MQFIRDLSPSCESQSRKFKTLAEEDPHPAAPRHPVVEARGSGAPAAAPAGCPALGREQRYRRSQSVESVRAVVWRMRVRRAEATRCERRDKCRRGNDRVTRGVRHEATRASHRRLTLRSVPRVSCLSSFLHRSFASV